MLRTAWTLAALVAIGGLSGCQGATPTAPEGAADAAAGTPGPVLVDPDGASLAVPAIYRWSIDPATLTATTDLLATRRAQDNDGKFFLSLENFLQPRHLKITSISRTADALALDYVFTHPFPSSEIANRADLGFTGLLMLLADVDTATGNTFYNSIGLPIILNRDLVLNADAYWKPEDLISTPGLTANAFPYRLIITDGGTGNRIDPSSGDPISNGNSPIGNFDPASGWQTAQGPSKNWTGFDVLHQGQAATGRFLLDLDTLEAAGGIDLDIAVIAKYMDPKSGTPGFEHRLPADPPDITGSFGYRYPYGALDCSKLIFEDQTESFVAGVDSLTALHFHIRDWDAIADVEMGPLANSGDPSVVPNGDAGPPWMWWSCPALEGPNHAAEIATSAVPDDSAYGGDPEADSGRAGDGLYYRPLIFRTGRPSDVRGRYPALIEVIDHDAYEPNARFLNPDLTPLTIDQVPPRNAYFLPIEVNMDGPLGPGWAHTYVGAQNEVVRDLAVDAEGRVWVAGLFDSTVDFGGGNRTSNGSFDCFLTLLSKEGTYLWDRTWGGADFDEVAGIALRPDSLGGIVTGSFAGEMTYNGVPYTATVTDGFVFQFDAAGSSTSTSFVKSDAVDLMGAPASAGTDNGFYIAGLVGGAADVCGYASPSGPNEGFIARLDQFNGPAWVTRLDHDSGNVLPTDITVLTSGAPITCGNFLVDADFGGGTRLAAGETDLFAVRLTADGDYVWDRTYGSTRSDRAWSIASGYGGVIALAGEIQGDCDLGGGPLDLPDDAVWGVVLSLTASGGHRWAQVTEVEPGYAGITGVGILPGTDGDVLVGGICATDGFFGGRPLEVQTKNGLIARLDIADGSAEWLEVLTSRNGHEINALCLGPAESVYYGFKWNGSVDVEPGPGVTTVTAPTTYTEIGVVKLYADGRW